MNNHHESCEGYSECCPGHGAYDWPDMPMCTGCKEWSISECEGCE